MNPSLPTRAARFGSALRKCSSGMALTEFALSLPVLMILGMGGLETANFALAHLRVSNIAVLTADNAARIRDSIDEGNVVELMTGAMLTGDSIAFRENGRIILSSLENDGTTQWIRWQRCAGALEVEPRYGTPLQEGGDPIDDGTEFFAADRNSASSDPSSPEESDLTGMGSAGNQITAQPGNAVMVVEVSYNYQPIIPNSFLEDREIRYESSFNVRQRTNPILYNANEITPRSCDTFAA